MLPASHQGAQHSSRSQVSLRRTDSAGGSTDLLSGALEELESGSLAGALSFEAAVGDELVITMEEVASIGSTEARLEARVMGPEACGGRHLARSGWVTGRGPPGSTRSIRVQMR